MTCSFARIDFQRVKYQIKGKNELDGVAGFEIIGRHPAIFVIQDVI
jgi:hypothetical protein